MYFSNELTGNGYHTMPVKASGDDSTKSISYVLSSSAAGSADSISKSSSPRRKMKARNGGIDYKLKRTFSSRKTKLKPDQANFKSAWSNDG